MDGPGIVMELIQNADDAGATEVGLMLDMHTYPTESLIGNLQIYFLPLLFRCALKVMRNYCPQLLLSHIISRSVVIFKADFIMLL